MQNNIIEVVGEVWNYFNENGNEPVSITTLAKKIDRKKEEVTFALGWLAREDKVHFDTTKSTIKVSLLELACC